MKKRIKNMYKFNRLNQPILMSILVLVFMVLLSMQKALAQPLSPNDFAFNAPLLQAENNSRASLRQVVLPVGVYEKMQRRDLGDLRVFSANGQVVPHQIQQVEQTATVQKMALPVHPLSEEQSNNPANIKVIINQQSDQQQLSIQQQLNATDKKINHIEYQYILENKNRQGRLCKITLDWKATQDNSIAPISLESSNDLQNWRSLGHGLNVSRFTTRPDSGQYISNDDVEFSCTKDKYLRLSWLKREQQNTLVSAQGHYQQGVQQALQWKSLGKPVYDKEGNWLFENDSVAALTQMAFVAPQNGLIYKGKLYSRNDKKAAWKAIQNISQYRLNLGSAKNDTQQNEFQSSPFSLAPNNDRYWKLHSQNEARLTQSQLPEIRVAWPQRQLIFLAQGEPPFRLAYGNPLVKPVTDLGLAQLIQGIGSTGVKPESVSLGKAHRVAAYHPGEAEKPIPWKTIGLWIVLLLGTGVLGYMALSLYRQMDDKSK